jgi:hypothetical protein
MIHIFDPSPLLREFHAFQPVSDVLPAHLRPGGGESAIRARQDQRAQRVAFLAVLDDQQFATWVWKFYQEDRGLLDVMSESMLPRALEVITAAEVSSWRTKQ